MPLESPGRPRGARRPPEGPQKAPGGLPDFVFLFFEKAFFKLFRARVDREPFQGRLHEGPGGSRRDPRRLQEARRL